jgi:hypothetical protein
MMRIRYAQRKQYMGSEEFSWNEISIAFTDPKLYLRYVPNRRRFECCIGQLADSSASGCIQFCQDILLYGFSTFLPSILKSSGYDTLQSNYLTIPVYIWGALCFYAVAYVSDKLTLRGPVSPSP